jgi:catechol 2,3-dioxygenase-like lactoylglutathione lyase family enzyme
MADPEVTTGFGATDAFGSFSVDDLAAARTFYADTLGLAVEQDGPVLRLELDPDRTVVLYPKADHVPAGFTVLNFAVRDLEAAVADLAGRGVTFERYDGFVHDEHGIVRGEGGPPIAWFTDPAGNVLAVLEDGVT